MMIKLKPKTDTFERYFYEFVWFILDQMDLFLNDHMKNQVLRTLIGNYMQLREQLHEKVHTPKTSRFFQLSSELLDMERAIYTWIGVAQGTDGGQSADELTKQMMQVLSDTPYSAKKNEWQLLKMEVADLFDPSDFSTLMEMLVEILNLQRQSCLASGKYLGQLLYQAFTEPNAEVLRSCLNIELDPAEF